MSMKTLLCQSQSTPLTDLKFSHNYVIMCKLLSLCQLHGFGGKQNIFLPQDYSTFQVTATETHLDCITNLYLTL